VASANLDLARSIYAAWGTGDFGSSEWAHADIEFAFVGGPEPGRTIGLPGMVETFRGFLHADLGLAAERLTGPARRGSAGDL
jgi:hypothetical protein